MPKTYFCKKITNDQVCGETNSENFEKGRYSLCRECRKLCSREQTIETKKIIEELNNKIKELENKIKTMENN